MTYLSVVVNEFRDDVSADSPALFVVYEVVRSKGGRSVVGSPHLRGEKQLCQPTRGEAIVSQQHARRYRYFTLRSPQVSLMVIVR